MNFAEKEQREASYPDVPYDLFLMFLRHVYSDQVKVDPKLIYDLLSVSIIYLNLTRLFQLADRFNVSSIKKKCEVILAQHIHTETVCQIFKYANTFNCERLKETCLLYTEENHKEVIMTAGFEELDRDDIIKIIRLGNESKKRKRQKQ